MKMVDKESCFNENDYHSHYGETMLQQNITKWRPSDFVVETPKHRWVIPSDCELLKRLLKVQGIQAEDLCFKSNFQCQKFIKQLFLLALADEYKNRTPSSLAKLARELVRTQNIKI